MRPMRLPHKMMVGMTIYVLCAVKNTSSHFVVNVMRTFVQNVFTCTRVGTKVFIRHSEAQQMSCFLCDWIIRLGVVLCALREWFGS